MALAVGTKLGPYQIIAPIGAGGMGEVYKASDTRLNRLVAIKISQARFSERFEREARAIAALNHPNICTLYDVGPNYLVMEYIEGRPLKPPVPIGRAIQHAIQVADALEAAYLSFDVTRTGNPFNSPSNIEAGAWGSNSPAFTESALHVRDNISGLTGYAGVSSGHNVPEPSSLIVLAGSLLGCLVRKRTA